MCTCRHAREIGLTPTRGLLNGSRQVARKGIEAIKEALRPLCVGGDRARTRGRRSGPCAWVGAMRARTQGARAQEGREWEMRTERERCARHNLGFCKRPQHLVATAKQGFLPGMLVTTARFSHLLAVVVAAAVVASMLLQVR